MGYSKINKSLNKKEIAKRIKFSQQQSNNKHSLYSITSSQKIKTKTKNNNNNNSTTFSSIVGKAFDEELNKLGIFGLNSRVLGLFFLLFFVTFVYFVCSYVNNRVQENQQSFN